MGNLLSGIQNVWDVSTSMMYFFFSLRWEEVRMLVIFYDNCHRFQITEIKNLRWHAAAKSLLSCPTVRPYRRRPTRLPHPWDSPGKNTGVGCHFLLQCMKVKSESEVAQLCLTLSDPMDCSLPGPPSMGFSRQEYWSKVPLPSPLLNITVSKMPKRFSFILKKKKNLSSDG